MEKPIVLLGRREGSVVPRLFEVLGGQGFSCRAVPLEAAFEGKAVRVSASEVLWQGVDLLAAAAVFVEQPLFPWPQPPLPAEEGATDREAWRAWSTRQREARSLTVAALSLAAEAVPVLNPPAAAHLAASPALALVLLEREGIAVRPWRLEPAREGGNGANEAPLLLDPAGPDLWHEGAGSPPSGELALCLLPAPGPVCSILVVGDQAAGCLGYDSYRSFVSDETSPRRGEPLGADSDPVGPSVQAAVAAAARLGIDFAAVTVYCDATGAQAIVLLRAAPDLDAWDRRLDGKVIPLLADHLARRAGRGSAEDETV